MGTEFDIIAWHRMMVFFLGGFLPAWAIVVLLSAMAPQTAMAQRFRQHYPKALPISNFFFCLSQLAGALMKPSYAGNIASEIGANPYFLLLTAVNALLLVSLFIRPGKALNRLVFISGSALLLMLIVERVAARPAFIDTAWWDLLSMGAKSVLWFLFLGWLIAISEWVKVRVAKK